MYEKLKQIMREAGYAVSEGAEWLASDMRHFVTFSRQVLGATTPHLNHLLAYPEAFPHVISKADMLVSGAAEAPVQSAEQGAPQVEPQTPAEPVAEPAEPVAPPPQESSVLDVSAAGQTDKQDLNATSTEEPAPSSEQPPAASDADQGTEQGAGAAQEGTDAAQASDQGDDAEKPADDQSGAATGEQPQE